MNLLLQRVVSLLTENPLYRDSDELLMARVWLEDMTAKLHSYNTSYITFLDYLSKRELTPYESITRMRRKAQELHPELRGNNYGARLENQESVKEDLRNSTLAAGLKVHHSFHEQSATPGTL